MIERAPTPSERTPPKNPPSVLRPPKAGLTLIEVVLAIAVAGFVLAAATSFVVSIAAIWSERDARNFFEDHVDGVTEFIRASFASAGTEIALATDENANGSGPGGDDGEEDDDQGGGGENRDDPPEVDVELTADGERGNAGTGRGGSSAAEGSGTAGLVRRSGEPVGWGRPPGTSDFEPPSLNIRLAEAPPLLVDAESVAALGVDAYLHYDREEGLSLLWSSILQEEVEDERDLRRTPLSPLVKEIVYIYWDERFEQWDELEEPKEGDGDDQFPLPRYLKLVFEYEGVTKERVIAIPVPSQSALIF